MEGSVYPEAVGTGLATGCRLSPAAHPSGSFFPAILSMGVEREAELWAASLTSSGGVELRAQKMWSLGCVVLSLLLEE